MLYHMSSWTSEKKHSWKEDCIKKELFEIEKIEKKQKYVQYPLPKKIIWIGIEIKATSAFPLYLFFFLYWLLQMPKGSDTSSKNLDSPFLVLHNI